MNDRRLFQRRCGVGGVQRGLVLLVVLLASRVSTGAEPGTVQGMYEEAQRLAQSPEGRDEAMAQYHAVIEIHRANEKTYHAALRQLANCYSESGQVEEGVRFFLAIAQELWRAKRPDVLKEILNEFKLKHPEVVDQIVAEMYPSSRSKTRSAPPVPAKDLTKAILQRRDAELREKALERLRLMLAETASDAEKRQGLATLKSALTAKFDRAPFRLLVLPLLASDDAQVRALALGCLPGLDATLDDLSLVAAMAQDDSAQVRESVGGALIQLGKGERPELVVPALMRLLQDEDSKVVERTIRSMWGQYHAPDFDALLIELSYEQKYHHNVIYFCLSTMRSKSPAVCRRLVEVLAEADWNDSGRAAWGLTYGVTEEAKGLVEEGLLEALPEETHAGTRKEEFRALQRVATERSRAYVSSVAESEMETEEIRAVARQILADLDRKQGQ